MRSPYQDLPRTAYWRTGVAEQHPLKPADIYRKKFAILPTDSIATAGSCFAQHISRHLRSGGYDVLDLEPPPAGLSGKTAQDFGYLTYTCRYGNIYTSRQLLQLAQEAYGKRSPGKGIVWERGGRFFDALRPGVEPEGFATRREVLRHRKPHLKYVREMFDTCKVFIFTFGLTETWEDMKTGTVFPTAPGTIAGEYDPARIRFRNLTYPEVLDDFLAFRDLVKAQNPDVRFLVTVSPVPLTATASGHHVLPATVYSKSVLRAVAGHLSDTLDDVDYFPSYEIIAAHPSRGFFFEGNLRSVSPEGVEVVMKAFGAQHKPVKAAAVAGKVKSRNDVVCEEALLEAFS